MKQFDPKLFIYQSLSKYEKRRMIQFPEVLSLIAAIGLVVSCSTTNNYIDKSIMDEFHPGMSEPEFKTLIGKGNPKPPTPTYMFQVESRGILYFVYAFSTESGTHTLYTSTYHWSPYGGYTQPVTEVITDYKDCLFVFDASSQNGLLFWGTESELLVRIIKIGPAAMPDSVADAMGVEAEQDPKVMADLIAITQAEALIASADESADHETLAPSQKLEIILVPKVIAQYENLKTVGTSKVP
jgi:hypothetical protein